MNGTTSSERRSRLSFTPEVEREWQQLRKTIQQEYRAERRQALLVTAGVLAGLAIAALALFESLGPSIG